MAVGAQGKREDGTQVTMSKKEERGDETRDKTRQRWRAGGWCTAGCGRATGLQGGGVEDVVVSKQSLSAGSPASSCLASGVTRLGSDRNVTDSVTEE
jgi:hypothetical protein